MAQVHPSRMGLVPGGNAPRPSLPIQESREEALKRKLQERKRGKDVDESRGSRERGHRDRSRSRSRDGDRKYQRGRDEDDRSRYDDRRRRDDSRPPRDRSSRPRTRSPPPPARTRDERHDLPPHLQQSHSRDEVRDRRDDRDRDRRPSPSYGRYQAPRPRREEAFIPLNGNGNGDGSSNIAKYGYGGARDDLPGPGPGQGGPPPPWRNGGGLQGGPSGFQAGGPRGAGGFVGPADFERRRVERETSKITVWPPSPKQPYRDEEERDADRKAARKAKKSKSSKKSKKRQYSSSDSDTDSEQERRRRRKRKEKERKKKYDSESSDDERVERKRKSRDEDKRDSKDKAFVDPADQWVEKAGEVIVVPPKSDLLAASTTAQPEPSEYSSDDDIGPRLPTEYNSRDKRRGGAYTNMLKGEGEAMAQFLESGERIPRRGEIGLESEQIEKFEDSGYVMSGNRHKRMTAVRMRKENQVINAEEKRAILNLQREEKMKKEGMIITQFREMMAENLKKQGIEEH